MKSVVAVSFGENTLPAVVVPIVNPLEVTTWQALVPTELQEILALPPLFTEVGVVTIETTAAGGVDVAVVVACSAETTGCCTSG